MKEIAYRSRKRGEQLPPVVGDLRDPILSRSEIKTAKLAREVEHLARAKGRLDGWWDRRETQRDDHFKGVHRWIRQEPDAPQETVGIQPEPEPGGVQARVDACSTA